MQSRVDSIAQQCLQKLLAHPLTFRRVAEVTYGIFRRVSGITQITIYARHPDDTADPPWSRLVGPALPQDNRDPYSYADRLGFVVHCYGCLPSQAVVTPREHRIAVVLRCGTRAAADLAREVGEDLRAAIEFAILQADEIATSRLAPKFLSLAASPPRGAEDHLAYRLLLQAKPVLPDWLAVSMWRTSRTQGSMQRIAELDRRGPSNWVPHEVPQWLRRGRRPLWQDPTGETPKIPDALLLIDEHANDVRDLRSQCKRFGRCIGLTFDLQTPLSLAVTDSRDQPRSLLGYSTNCPHGERALVRDRLGALFSHLVLPPSGIVLALSVSSAFDFVRAKNRIDLHLSAPQPFQSILVLVSQSWRDVYTPALASLWRSLRAAGPAFDLVSQERAYLRGVIELLRSLRETSALEGLAAILEPHLRNLFDTPYYLLVDAGSQRIVQAASDLTSFVGEEFPLPEFSKSGIFSATTPADYPKVEAQRVLSRIHELSRLALSSFSPPVSPRGSAKLALVDEYDKPGFAACAVGATMALVVLHPKMWKLRALEEVSLRIVSDALSSAIARSAPVVSTATSPNYQSIVPRSPWDARRMSVRFFASYVKDLVTEYFPRSPYLLAAIDRNGAFFSPLEGTTGLRPRTPMALTTQSLIGKCFADGRSIRARVHKSSWLKCDDGTVLPYHRLITVGNEVVAVPLAPDASRRPLAVLVVGLPQDEEGDQSRLIDDIISMAETISMVLSYRESQVIREAANKIRDPLAQLRHGIEASSYPKLSDLRTLSSGDDPRLESLDVQSPLPFPIALVLTRKFRSGLCKVLETLREVSDASSITVRIRDARDSLVANDLYCVAFAGRGIPHQPLPYDPRHNVNSYVLSNRPLVVCIPDVKDRELTGRLYPGLVYFNARSDTRAELCFRLTDVDHVDVHATLNIEHNALDALWAHQEAFTVAADRIGFEIAAEYRRFARDDEYIAKLALLFARRSGHDLFRNRIAVRQALEPIRSQLDAFAEHEPSSGVATARPEDLRSVVDSLDVLLETLNLLDASAIRIEPFTVCDAATAALESFMQRTRLERTSRSVKPVDSVLRPQLEFRDSQAFVPGLVVSLIATLLVEQLHTLDMMSGDKPVELALGLRQHDNGWSLDILSTAAPSEVNRSLAPYLFYCVIDDPDRAARGRSGAGLFLLGSTLRALDVYPQAHAFPSSEILALYGNKYTGVVIELPLRPGGDINVRNTH